MRIFEINSLTNTIQREIQAHNLKIMKSKSDFSVIKILKKLKSDPMYKQYQNHTTSAISIVNKLNKKYGIQVCDIKPSPFDTVVTALQHNELVKYNATHRLNSNWNQIKDAIVLASLCNDGNNIANIVREQFGVNTIN